MPFVFKRLALFMSIAAAFAADKEAPFKAAPAASYAAPPDQRQVTIGVDPYVSGDKIKTAFGKLDPYNYGILPVLVVIQNDTARNDPAGSAEGNYNGHIRASNHIDAISPPSEVKFVAMSKSYRRHDAGIKDREESVWPRRKLKATPSPRR